MNYISQLLKTPRKSKLYALLIIVLIGLFVLILSQNSTRIVVEYADYSTTLVGENRLCGYIDPKEVIQAIDNADELQNHLTSNTIMYIDKHKIDRKNLTIFSDFSYTFAFMPDNKIVLVGTPISFCTLHNYPTGKYSLELHFTDLHDISYLYSWDILLTQN